MEDITKPKKERVGVWNDNGAICVIAVSPYGDPVDMSIEEAKAFAEEINNCIKQAEIQET